MLRNAYDRRSRHATIRRQIRAVRTWRQDEWNLASLEMRLAIADYDLALGQDPEFTLAYFNRGIAYEKIGEREKCIADYRKALSLEPALVAARERLQHLGVPLEGDKTPGAKPATGA